MCLKLTCFAYELESRAAGVSMPNRCLHKHSVDFTIGWLSRIPVCEVVCARAVCPRPVSTTGCAVTSASAGGDVVVETNPTMPVFVVTVSVKQVYDGLKHGWRFSPLTLACFLTHESTLNDISSTEFIFVEHRPSIIRPRPHITYDTDHSFNFFQFFSSLLKLSVSR